MLSEINILASFIFISIFVMVSIFTFFILTFVKYNQKKLKKNNKTLNRFVFLSSN